MTTTPYPSVYAAGSINGLSYDAAHERRLYVARALAPHGIEVISPMRWKGRLKGIERLGAGDDVYEADPVTAAKGIVARDRFDVQRCWLMLADLEHPARTPLYEYEGFSDLFEGAPQSSLEVGSLGTMTEFGWADAYRKLIVTILKPGGVHDHPFVRALSGFIVPDLDSAIDVIKSVLLAEPFVHGAPTPERGARRILT